MRVAIVHYHLQTGGVTRIIQHAQRVLGERGVTLAVLSGEPPQGGWEGPVQVVQTLAYDERRPACEPGILAMDLQRAAWEALGGAPDIWHVHNHSLGKNTALPKALLRLAEDGQRLLLQIHDFPEDGRPEHYRRLLDRVGAHDVERLSHILYPRAGQVHYAVLNARDEEALAGAGCASGQLHRLPNPVWIEPQAGLPAAGRREDTRLWLYPTRAIRRKNLGEFLLWAARAGADDRYATTRGPENPAERPRYEDWVAFAQSLKLPVEFALGERWQGSLGALLRSAHALVTTSVAEGFGLAFLEPWLAGRPVVGRDLPEITHEFQAEGVDLDGLYTRLEVPMDWVGWETLEAKAREGLERMLGAYGRSPREEHVTRCLNTWVRDRHVDFGRLDEPLQQQVIRRVAGSQGAGAELRPARLAQDQDWEGRIQRNRAVVQEDYCLARYGERLLEIYAQVLESPEEPLEALSGQALLSRFLAPERLYLLRS
jgi:glycosyltransferase involved in cell wall biosynthesis